MPEIARRGGGATARSFARAFERMFAVSPLGAPDKPLLEAALMFSAFYLFSYLPTDPAAAGGALADPRYFGLIVLELAPKSLVLLYVMARADGLAAFGIARPRLASLGRGMITALGAICAAAFPALVFERLGWTNPLLESVGGGASILILPLVIAASLAIGYAEELFFRVYLVKRLGQAGLPSLWAALASTLVFGSAHGLQGLPGLIVASGIGGWLAWRWLKGRDLHEIALAHAMYDAAVMAAALFG